jgi:hypothetical protein
MDLRAGQDVVEYLAPPGFDPRTVQALTSFYTDYAIPDPTCHGEYV